MLEKILFFFFLEKTLESPLDHKEIQPVHPKRNQPWIFIGRTGAEVEAPILWPTGVKSWLTGKDWFWERLKAGGEGDDRAWDGWMASPTRWTWVWAGSGRQWRTGQPPGMLQPMGLQRAGQDWVTDSLSMSSLLAHGTYASWTPAPALVPAEQVPSGAKEKRGGRVGVRHHGKQSYRGTEPDWAPEDAF